MSDPPNRKLEHATHPEFFYGYENPFMSMKLSDEQKANILSVVEGKELTLIPDWKPIEVPSPPLIQIATQLYAQAISHPVGVNEEQPDYDQLAKDCVEKAQRLTPHLLKALGLAEE